MFEDKGPLHHKIVSYDANLIMNFMLFEVTPCPLCSEAELPECNTDI